MPYIVTAKRPPCGDPSCFDPNASCCAVATLEDPPNSTESGVHGLLDAMVPEETTAHEHDDLYEQIDTVIALGEGTVGPLPDGTVIEVGEVDWGVLILAAGFDPNDGTTAYAEPQIIDAFNAKQFATLPPCPPKAP